MCVGLIVRCAAFTKRPALSIGKEQKKQHHDVGKGCLESAFHSCSSVVAGSLSRHRQTDRQTVQREPARVEANWRK